MIPYVHGKEFWGCLDMVWVENRDRTGTHDGLGYYMVEGDGPKLKPSSWTNTTVSSLSTSYMGRIHRFGGESQSPRIDRITLLSSRTGWP
jgi:hypothetical protein